MGIVELEVTFAPRSRKLLHVPPTTPSSMRLSKGKQTALDTTLPESPAKTQSSPSSFPVESPCNGMHSSPQSLRATSSPSSSLYNLPPIGSASSFHGPPSSDSDISALFRPPPDGSLDGSSCSDSDISGSSDRSHTSSLDEPPLPPTPTFDQLSRPPTASPKELTFPALPVEKYHLFVQVNKSFTIQQENGTESTSEVVGSIRVDDVESDIDVDTLKSLVSEAIRRELAPGPGQAVALEGYDCDPFDIDNFFLVYEGYYLYECEYATLSLFARVCQASVENGGANTGLTLPPPHSPFPGGATYASGMSKLRPKAPGWAPRSTLT